MSTTEVPVNEKRGWSSFCRRGDHGTCETVGARCECSHHGPGGQRPPEPRAKEAAMPRGVKGSGPYGRHTDDAPPQTRAPVIELEWEDPPPDVPVGVAAYLGVLDQLRERKADWARIATFDSSRGAGAAAAKLRKSLADGVLGNFEFESRVNGQGSKLYARCTGAN